MACWRGTPSQGPRGTLRAAYEEDATPKPVEEPATVVGMAFKLTVLVAVPDIRARGEEPCVLHVGGKTVYNKTKYSVAATNDRRQRNIVKTNVSTKQSNI